MNENTILLRHTFSDELGMLMQKRGYICCPFYKYESNYLLRNIRRLWLKWNLPFANIWFSKEVLNHSGRIVVFESLCSVQYLKWLREHKKMRILYFGTGILRRIP